MIYEMRTYTIGVGKMQEYLQHFQTIGLPIISRYSTLIGWWCTEIGELNQVVHIWAYQSFEGRMEKRAELYRDQDWLHDFVPKAFPMIKRQESKLLLAADFSPIK